MSLDKKAALTGLLLGDGMSRQNGVQRLPLTTARRVNRYQILTKFSFDNKMTTFPEPYVHAFPEKLLKVAPGDDCEWFFFSANIVKNDLSVRDEWERISNNHLQISARLGTKTALRNISKGIKPPHSGHDNAHYFDSIGMLRAVAISLFHDGAAEELKKIVTEDISHTHSLDGLWCSLSIATFISEIKAGKDVTESIQRALTELPKDSLSLRLVDQALAISKKSNNSIELAFNLEQELIDRIYCYPYAAAELLALTFAILQSNNDPQSAFTASFLHRRHNDSLPAFMGLILGYIYGDSWLPNLDSNIFNMDGICIPELKNLSLLDLLK